MDLRASVLLVVLGIGLFIAAAIDDRGSCQVLSETTSTSQLTLAPTPPRVSSSFSVRLGRREVVGQVWILDRRSGAGWTPTWQLIASIDGSRWDVRSIDDGFPVTDVGIIGPRTIRFRFPEGLRSGALRLRPRRDAAAPALQLEVACRSGRIAEWYGRIALALHG